MSINQFPNQVDVRGGWGSHGFENLGVMLQNHWENPMSLTMVLYWGDSRFINFLKIKRKVFSCQGQACFLEGVFFGKGGLWAEGGEG